MQQKLAAVTLVTKYEKHMPVCLGLSGVVRMSNNASENTTQNDWTHNETKDVELKEILG